MTIAKRVKANKQCVTPGKSYSVTEAIEIIQNKLQKAKFEESVDLSVRLGVDPKKTNEAVRGSIVLPNGTGRSIRVAVFTSAANAEKAKAAGADLVGLEDLAEQVKAGKIDFDMVLATPDAMRVVGQLGQVLGPRGLMPNPKDGTVTPDIANAVKNAKMGQVRYRTEKAGIIHCTVGKVKFTAAALTENITAVMSALRKAKPATSKGIYFRKITLSTTMGPGISIDVSSISV